MKKQKSDSSLVQQLSLSVSAGAEDLAPQVEGGGGVGEHDKELFLQAQPAQCPWWGCSRSPWRGSTRRWSGGCLCPAACGHGWPAWSCAPGPYNTKDKRYKYKYKSLEMQRQTQKNEITNTNMNTNTSTNSNTNTHKDKNIR